MSEQRSFKAKPVAPPPYDPAAVVYTPAQVSTYGVQAIQKARANQAYGIPLPIPGIREYFAPVTAGQLTVILAQTHHYKSGFLHFWEHETARWLTSLNRHDEAIIHVSVEECVEEQAFLEFARFSGEDPGRMARGDVQDWEMLLASSVQVGAIPIYRIGDSLAKADMLSNLYLSNIIRSLRALVEGKITGKPVKPAMICFDYLQAFPIDPEVSGERITEQRRLQVRQDTYRLRQAAVFFNCPVTVAVQAKQNLSCGPTSPIQMPGMYDGEESSSIAQRADRQIGLWMPKNNHPVGSKVDAKGYSFYVKENQLWVKILKQRGGLPSGKAWPCLVDFKQNMITPELLQAMPPKSSVRPSPPVLVSAPGDDDEGDIPWTQR